MFACQVGRALHLDEAAGGALEERVQPAAGIELGGSRRRGDYEIPYGDEDPGRWRSIVGSIITGFNDDQNVRQEDVLTVLDEAIRDLKGRPE